MFTFQTAFSLQMILVNMNSWKKEVLLTYKSTFLKPYGLNFIPGLLLQAWTQTTNKRDDLGCVTCNRLDACLGNKLIKNGR